MADARALVINNQSRTMLPKPIWAGVGVVHEHPSKIYSFIPHFIKITKEKSIQR